MDEALRLALRLATAMLSTFAAMAMSAPVSSPPAAVKHAWFVPVKGAAMPPGGTVRVWRNNAILPSPTPYLHACDTIELLDDKALVLIQLADARLLMLSAQSPRRRVQVPCEQRPVLDVLADSIRAFMGDKSSYATRAAGMATRSSLSQAPLELPMMDPPVLRVSSSRSSLYVWWTGGVQPFQIALLDESTGSRVDSKDGVRQQQAELSLPRGSNSAYRVIITGADGEGIKLTGIQPVPPEQDPREPAELAAIKDAAIRAFLYAEYLASVEGGAWALEAVQRMSTLAPRSVAAREWLRTHGGASN